jgi:hypothetical protein
MNYEKLTPIPEKKPLERLFKRKKDGQDEFFLKSRIIAMMKYNCWDLFNIKKTEFFGTPHTKAVLPIKCPRDDWLKKVTQKLRLQQKRLKRWKLLQCIVGIDTKLEKRRQSKLQRLMKRKGDLLIPIPTKPRSEQLIKDTKKYPETLYSKQLDDKFDAQIWYKLVQRPKARLEADAEAKARIEAEQAEAAANFNEKAKAEAEGKEKFEAVQSEAAAKAEEKEKLEAELESKLSRTKEHLKILKSREEKKMNIKLYKKTFEKLPFRQENKKSIQPLADLEGKKCLQCSNFKFGIQRRPILNHLKETHRVRAPKSCNKCQYIYETKDHECQRDTNTGTKGKKGEKLPLVRVSKKASFKNNHKTERCIVEKVLLSEDEEIDVADSVLPSVPQNSVPQIFSSSEDQGDESPQVRISVDSEMSPLLDDSDVSNLKSAIKNVEPVIIPFQDSGLGSSPDQAEESDISVEDIFAEVVIPPMMSGLRDTPRKKKYFNSVFKGRIINNVKKLQLSEGKSDDDLSEIPRKNKSLNLAFKGTSIQQVKEVNLSESECESDADLPEIP